MTFAVDPKLNRTPALSPDAGWQYHPSSLTGTFIKEGNRKLFKNQASRFMRRTPAFHRDPVAVALIIDGLLRMEHDHALTSNELAGFMNREYRQFAWNPITIGRIMLDLAEAAKMPGFGPDDLPICAYECYGTNVFQVNPRPLPWSWLNHIRYKVGERAETALETDGTGKDKGFWPDFPYELAQLD